MSDLVEFLRARLDEDEMTAMAAGDRAWIAEVLAGGYPQRVSEDGSAILICETYDGPVDNTGLKWSPVSAQHIARFDPARVRAEVKAKRAIVALHRDLGLGFCADCDSPSPCPTLRPLAAVYSGHPDYRQEWAL